MTSLAVFLFPVAPGSTRKSLLRGSVSTSRRLWSTFQCGGPAWGTCIHDESLVASMTLRHCRAVFDVVRVHRLRRRRRHKNCLRLLSTNASLLTGTYLYGGWRIAVVVTKAIVCTSVNCTVPGSKIINNYSNI